MESRLVPERTREGQRRRKHEPGEPSPAARSGPTESGGPRFALSDQSSRPANDKRWAPVMISVTVSIVTDDFGLVSNEGSPPGRAPTATVTVSAQPQAGSLPPTSGTPSSATSSRPSSTLAPRHRATYPRTGAPGREGPSGPDPRIWIPHKHRGEAGEQGRHS